jgi:hypothetical protein
VNYSRLLGIFCFYMLYFLGLSLHVRANVTLLPRPEYARQFFSSPSKEQHHILPAFVKPLADENQQIVKSIERDKQMIGALNKRLENFKASPNPSFKDKRAIHSSRQLISELEKTKLEKEQDLEALKHGKPSSLMIPKNSSEDCCLKKNTNNNRLPQ